MLSQFYTKVLLKQLFQCICNSYQVYLLPKNINITIYAQFLFITLRIKYLLLGQYFTSKFFIEKKIQRICQLYLVFIIYISFYNILHTVLLYNTKIIILCLCISIILKNFIEIIISTHLLFTHNTYYFQYQFTHLIFTYQTCKSFFVNSPSS